MKEFFYDLFIYPFTDGFWGSIFGLIIWILMIGLISFLLWGSLYLVDSVGLKYNEGKGVIVEKIFEPTHTSHSFIYVGKIMVPQTHYYDDAWIIKIDIDGAVDNVSLNQGEWDKLSINQTINCEYKCGRIFKSIYIKNVSW